jgi:hypothetical protein
MHKVIVAISFLAMLSLSVQARAERAVTQPDTQPDAQPDTQPDAQPDTQPDAQPDTQPDTQPTDAPTEWYGWQTLLADGLSIGTMALGGALDSPAFAVLGLTSFILTPPIIHMAHSKWLAAGVSLTLRAGGTALIIAGLAIALSNLDFNTDNENRASNDGGAVALSVLGLLALIAAPIVDAAMATQKREEQPAHAWSVQPWLSPQTGGGGIMLGARL